MGSLHSADLAFWFSIVSVPDEVRHPVFEVKALYNILCSAATDASVKLDLEEVEKWIRNSIGDVELADRIRKSIESNKSVRDVAELIKIRMKQSEDIEKS